MRLDGSSRREVVSAAKRRISPPLHQIARDSYAFLATFFILTAGLLLTERLTLGAAVLVGALVAGWSSSWSP